MDEKALKTLEAMMDIADTSGAAEQLVEAFEAFMLAFKTLKADNEEERRTQTLTLKNALRDVERAIASIKNGKTPIPGIDFPSKDQIKEMIVKMIPAPKDGYTPVLGIDYQIPSKEEILQAVMERMDPADVFAALFHAPDNVISAVNSGESQINMERVEGLEALRDEVRKKHWPPFYVGTAGLATGTSSGGIGVADEVVTAIQSGSNVTIDLGQLGHTYSTVLQVRRNGIPQVRAVSWTQSGSTVTVLGADASEYFEVQYTYAT